MGVATIDPVRYGELLAKALPKVIGGDEEFDLAVAQLEALDFAKRDLTPEEVELQKLLARLIEDYDDKHYEIPDAPPIDILHHLMEQKGIRQADLVPVLGPRSLISQIVTGKRGISKATAKKLGQYFGVDASLFL